MMKPAEWLDKAKKKLVIDSDYELAKVIGVSQSALTNIRKRNAGIDNYIAARLEDILEIKQMSIIIDMEIQKAKNEEKRKYWKKKEQIYLNS